MGSACLLDCARAADVTAARARHMSGAVMMMVGGMANSDDAVEPATPSMSAQSVVSPDDSRPLSVVFQPGAVSSTASTPRGSASVASRVMALLPLINEAARAANVDSALLMAVIDVESGGDPQAVSPKGATGLMQLMPGTGARHGASDLFDPLQNVNAGARYLKQLMRQFGDLQAALAAYNAGEGAVQKHGGQIPPYRETVNYVPKVIDRYFRYRDAISSTATMQEKPLSGSVIGRLLQLRQTGGD
ncbi:lytic transglycosylase [Paraburkholderia lacunae]|uniref:Lytic transglycosylase n=1 Tax=Paraburkholderia lacunae TaxID=2211104 RepID=A0A370N9F5_9BURK|nr:lytic transglycosylase [Paraburkholderia lacunae]